MFKVFALADSLVQSHGRLHVLVTDSSGSYDTPANVILYGLSRLSNPVAEKLIAKYRSSADKLRWAMKAPFIRFLLPFCNKVVYIDNDVHFFDDASFLFEELNNNRVLLTPHYYPADPCREQNWLEANFRVGLYNAGFFAARQGAEQVLDWWMECCLYNIKKSSWRGLFDDQKYLDLVPVLFEEAGILRHRGCNLAGWNYRTCKVSGSPERPLVDDRPVVFIHFAGLTMREFARPGNPFHMMYRSYLRSLRTYHPSWTFREKKWSRYRADTFFYYVKWRFFRLFNR